MTRADAVQRYVAVPAEFKARFLLRLAHNLTVEIRGFYRSDNPLTSSAYKYLIGLNELNHHMSAEATNHLMNGEERYPDDVFANILIDIANSNDLAPQFAGAFQRTVASFSR